MSRRFYQQAFHHNLPYPDGIIFYHAAFPHQGGDASCAMSFNSPAASKIAEIMTPTLRISSIVLPQDRLEDGAADGAGLLGDGQAMFPRPARIHVPHLHVRLCRQVVVQDPP